MATFLEIKTIADKTYLAIWNDWFRHVRGIIPARHDFCLSDLSAGYNHPKNQIINPIPEGNFNDSDILDDSKWNIWKIQLVHEMLHEYQHKVVSRASPEGSNLYLKFKNSFSGKGHDEKFFTAIAKKASYFNLTPEELIGRL